MNEKYLQPALNYLIEALQATGVHLLVLLGPLIVLALIMHFVSSGLRNLGFEAFGEKGFVYGFKMIGTPVHELGHAVFALMFGHRVVSVKWFDPNGRGGTYGFVKTRYTRGNPFHETGLFFSGIGPVMMCALMLYVITWLLFGTGIHNLFDADIFSENFLSVDTLTMLLHSITSAVKEITALLFTNADSKWWKVVLFIYLFFSIGSSMTLSPPDVKLATKGFLFFSAILFLFNIATLWAGGFLYTLFTKTALLLSGFLTVMVMALVIQLIFAIILLVVVVIKRGIRG